MTGNSYYSFEEVDAGRRGATTQAETRVYNERLVLTLVRKNGPLSKVELTRLTGLSAQSLTSIVNKLADAGLLVRHEPVRGGLGQPSIPFGLNPEGAFSYGLTISNRHAEFTMLNLLGELLFFERLEYSYPTPAKIMEFANKAIKKISRSKKARTPDRVVGLGIAFPFQIWSRNDVVGKYAAELMEWQKVDIRVELAAQHEWPVYLFNDGMVATAAELMFGMEASRSNFLFAYIGYFLSGGLVLDNHLFPGRGREAGALGFIPLPNSGQNRPEVSLMGAPALATLAQLVEPSSREQFWMMPQIWEGIDDQYREWVENVSLHLANAAANSAALIDIDCIVIDGAMPDQVRFEIVSAVRDKLAEPLKYRSKNFEVSEGSFGYRAPIIGAGSIPLMANFTTNKDMLFKE